ncbi:helix-turn-helix domain-containing protein [Desulfotomaculum sp. 1211_IL3151]|uniref:helix-turn-helix domain-containing protein n=1 Tax=Desulfotomaculum sp. 1211_IL3151 TaxID=3084055 RepID=UPI002FDB5B4D
MANQIGQLLTELREKAGFDSMGQLYKVSGVSVATLSRIENNIQKPNPETLKKLAPHLRVSLETLMAAAGYLIEGEADEIDLLDVLEGKNKLLVAGQPISQSQRLNLFQVLDNPSALKSQAIPLIGEVRMGIPILAQGWDRKLEIPSDIRADFALETHGDSMLGVGLLDGDYAICREAQTAHSGNIVVGLQRTSSETSDATLKFYFKEKDRRVLRAANPNYEDIVMDEDWYIGGVLVGILRKGSPAYRVYNSYLAARDINEEKWDPVFERASQLGIKPEQVMSMIETMHQIMKGN